MAHTCKKKKTKSKVIVKKHDTYMYNGIISRVNDSYMAHVEKFVSFAVSGFLQL